MGFMIKDSGKRAEYETGAKRDTAEGKGRFDLISPIFLTRLAKHLEGGAKKYGDRNWEKGQPLHRFLDSAFRHLVCYMMGQRDEDHLTASAWNLQGFIHTEEMIRQGKLPASLDTGKYLGDPPVAEEETLLQPAPFPFYPAQMPGEPESEREHILHDLHEMGGEA